jgi:hypothetical protein
MDGSTFRREQGRDPVLSAIPVLVFSAYLAKPLTMNSLLETVARVRGRQANPC